MKINVDLTYQEYITLLVAVQDKKEEYRQNIPCSTKHKEEWKKAHKEATSLLNKLYAAENPT